MSKSVQFEWQEWQGLSYLTCTLLKDWPHGFFTAQFYPQRPNILVKALHSNASAYEVKQVHGNRIVTPEEIEKEGDCEGDGIITTNSLQAIWVKTADCTPVLIGDISTGKSAALHAGWRGTALGIVPKAVEMFVAGGSKVSDLLFALGPAIMGEVYQVGLQVAVEVGRSIIEGDDILEVMRKEGVVLEEPQPDRVRLDVRKVISLQLQQLGVEKEQVAIAAYCTYQQPELFFSYRRTKEKKVQWSGILS